MLFANATDLHVTRQLERHVLQDGAQGLLKSLRGLICLCSGQYHDLYMASCNQDNCDSPSAAGDDLDLLCIVAARRQLCWYG